MKFIGIIPARYASTRFPGKPLADMKGKYMIQRVYEQARKVLDNVCVATDDDRIFNAVESFGGNVVMTSAEHRSGTDRCFEAYNRLGGNEDVIINIQGDEPFIKPEQIESLIACFDSPQTQIATLVRPFEVTEGYEALANPNSPKVILNDKNEALYFSRSIIPYMRNISPNNGPINTFTTSTSACMDTEPTYCPRSPSYPSRRSKSQNRSNNSGGCKTAIRLKWASPHKKQSV